jgi:hypothetical protein
MILVGSIAMSWGCGGDDPPAIYLKAFDQQGVQLPINTTYPLIIRLSAGSQEKLYVDVTSGQVGLDYVKAQPTTATFEKQDTEQTVEITGTKITTAKTALEFNIRGGSSKQTWYFEVVPLATP